MTRADQDKYNAEILARDAVKLEDKKQTKQDIADKLTDAHDLLIRAMLYMQSQGIELPANLKADLNKHFKRKVK